MARMTLVPKTRWKPGKSLEEVSFDEGVVHALQWLEHNHSRVELSTRQGR